MGCILGVRAVIGGIRGVRAVIGGILGVTAVRVVYIYLVAGQ